MYEVSMKPVYSQELNSLIWKWYLETPSPGALQTLRLRFSGWALGKNASDEIKALVKTDAGILHEMPINVIRQDVVDLENVPNGDNRVHCGFSFEIELPQLEGFHFGFRIGATDLWIREFEVIHAVKVLEGLDRYLFLDNDTNRSVDQFRGDFLLGDYERALWETHLNESRELADQAMARLSVLVAPSKEDVFPDKYPFARGKETSIDQFLGHFEDRVLYPIKELSDERELAFSRTDTHWTDYGALLAATALLKHWALPNLIQIPERLFRISHLAGDLGNKLCPPRLSPVVVAEPRNNGTKKVFENRIVNHGRICVYENQDSATEETIVIFGGSSAFNLAPILSEVFRRVCSVYTGGGWVREFVEHEKPSHVLIQTNQRFIVNPPLNLADFWKTAAHKIGNMDKGEQRTLLRAMHSATHSFSEPYARRILEMIKP